MTIKFLSSLFSSPPSDHTNHFQRLYEDAHNSCTAYLSPDEAIILSKTCRAFAGYLAIARNRITHLDLATKKITDEGLSRALGQHPKLTSIRLANPPLISSGILALGRFFEGRIMQSIELVNCRCLFDFPLESKILIEKIHFVALQHFSLSWSDDIPEVSLNSARHGTIPFISTSTLNRNYIQPLASQLRTCKSLKTLDFSLLTYRGDENFYGRSIAEELVESFPNTLENFGPFPITSFDIAMRNIPSKNIQKCDLSNLSAISMQEFRAIMRYLPFSQMSHVFITEDTEDLVRSSSTSASADRIFEDILRKIPICQRLTALHLSLTARQSSRLIPLLPDTLTELGPLPLNEEGISLLLNRNLKNIESCDLELRFAHTEKVRELLESLPLATMHQIILRGLAETRAQQQLTQTCDQIKKNTNLKTLKLELSIEDEMVDFIPLIINSIRSPLLEVLFIEVESNLKIDKQNTIKTLTLQREKLRFYPRLREVNVRVSVEGSNEIGDDGWPIIDEDWYITLDLSREEPKLSSFSTFKNKIRSLFKKSHPDR